MTGFQTTDSRLGLFYIYCSKSTESILYWVEEPGAGPAEGEVPYYPPLGPGYLGGIISENIGKNGL